MKNILKRIGVLGIILAIIIPFLELPVANAENDDCKSYHLQNYLFLDVDSLSSYGDGYTTYALFTKNFARGEVKILSIDKNLVNTASDGDKFWQLYAQTVAQTAQFDKRTGNFAGYLFTHQNSDKYDDVTTIAHAFWGKYTENGEPIQSGWQEVAARLANSSNKKFLQNEGSLVFEQKNVTVKAANYDDFRFTSNNVYTDLTEYLEDMANDDEETYIPLEITRKFTTEQTSKIYGVKFTDNTTKMYEPDGTYASYLKCGETLKDSTKTFDDCLTDVTSGKTVEVYTHEGLATDYSNESTAAIHYYWPYILSVEYCITDENVVDDPIEEDEWTLSYDLNVNDNSASNRPSSASAPYGETIEVSSTTPKRSGYKFLKWCTQSDGNGSCYTSGDDVKSPSNLDITLYAQWGSTEGGENKKTGVISYVIGFISVGAVAGGLYLLAKRKDLFRQI